MAGDVGQLQHQFILQQSRERESGILHQQIFLTIIVLGDSTGFVGNKAEPTVHSQSDLCRVKATLTCQRNHTIGIEMEPCLRLTRDTAPAFRPRLPLNRTQGLSPRTGLGYSGKVPNVHCAPGLNTSEGQGLDVQRTVQRNRLHDASVRESRHANLRKPQADPGLDITLPA